MGPLDESCCLLPAPWRSHQAYPATATTRADTAAATSRCVYSISVGRSSGGSNLPLHSGQCSPQPIPEPVIRTMAPRMIDRKSTRLNSSHLVISYAVFCLKKKKKKQMTNYVI